MIPPTDSVMSVVVPAFTTTSTHLDFDIVPGTDNPRVSVSNDFRGIVIGHSSDRRRHGWFTQPGFTIRVGF